jgi:hypothetical protein
MDITCIRQQADAQQIVRCKERVSELNTSFDQLSNGLDLVGNKKTKNSFYFLKKKTAVCL